MPGIIVGVVALALIVLAGVWYFVIRDDSDDGDLISALQEEGLTESQARCLLNQIGGAIGGNELRRMIADDDYEPTPAQALALMMAFDECDLWGFGFDGDFDDDFDDDFDWNGDDDFDDSIRPGTQLPPALLRMIAQELAADTGLSMAQAECFVEELFSEFGDDLFEELMMDPDALATNSAMEAVFFRIAATCGFDPSVFDDDFDDDFDFGFEGGFTYGDNPALDRLWDACDGGSMAACDELYMTSEIGSEYERFGDTCGGRQPEGTGAWCD